MQKKGTVIALLVLVVVLAGALVFTNLNFGSAEVVLADEAQLSDAELKIQSYVETSHIVTATTAANLLENVSDVLLLDIRNAAEYATGRIPGAVNIFRGDYSADSDEYPFGGMRAGKEKMEALLSSLGVTEDTLILAYDGKHSYDAARFWWQLDMYGHDNVKIIDGGTQGWEAAGFDLTIAPAEERTPTEFEFLEDPDYSTLATLEDVLEAQDDPNVVILDTRALSEFTGEELKRGATRPGRIPESVWMEYTETIQEDTTIKPFEELRAQLVAAGLTRDKTIIAYCQSGVRSSHTTFVLTELLGYPNVKNYEGSWIEYSFNEDLPVDMGDANISAN
ncbi:MAG: sulfurtransferase [Alkalispirochaetaceae bacterium]